ncbi:RNA-binding protein 4 isoform X1 [Pteronotus mesoamericanus]|uniref:RNA-binding protein 4 isoform X1 n=1 Tax=Pteronotus mesoamericanus TaxID=1884717 RepID=UPI0023EADA4C|nr:RNA-binding protein 4 isoform X1 [Pteronotus parnellii mesoamericanus]
MVKLFIGNLPREATEQEIRTLFEQYGKVLECDIIKNYGFVHIEDKTAAEDAIRNLHHYKLHGVNINVEASKNKSKTSTKLHVGNISPTCTNKELRAKFEEYGPVIECDIVKDYAFVHMERAEDAVEAIRGLDNTEFQGKRMHVQLSTSRLRTAPGMGDQSGCYRCGKEGHWSKECPIDRSGRVADFTEQYNEQYGAVRTPYTMSYGDSLYYNNAYGALDAYYKRCRAARSYEAVAAAAASAYNYAEQTLSHLPQVQNTAMASHLTSTSLDPYDRHLLPTSGAAATAAAAAAAAAAVTAASTSYYGRDRSPLRRATGPVPTVGEGYGYGHDSELSQASAAARNSLYNMARWDVCGLKFRAAVVHENTPFMVPCLRDVLGSVRSVPQELWTLIYLAKFRPPLPFLSPAHFPVLPVLQYFCSFPFMFCSPSRPRCVQKLWWGLCRLPTSCLQWVLDLGMTLVRVSLLLSLWPKGCGR